MRAATIHTKSTIWCCETGSIHSAEGRDLLVDTGKADQECRACLASGLPSPVREGSALMRANSRSTFSFLETHK